jgi:hypothetical protein
MDHLGVMVYGYSEDEAKSLHGHLQNLMDTDISLISGSGREQEVVETILTDEVKAIFQDASPKILMFLGFSDKMINLVLDEFSSISDVARPIFCGLTENNVKWSLQQLLDHLIEEQRYWAEQQKKGE